MNKTSPRQHCVSVRLSQSELCELDKRRGKIKRGTYLRHASANKLPPQIPAINQQAWVDLGRSLGNLATLATAMRRGDFVELEAITKEIKETRLRLISAQPKDNQ